MRSGWRVVRVALVLLAAFSGARVRADAPPAEISEAERAQLKEYVKEADFEKAEKVLENWRRGKLEKDNGEPLLDDKASMEDLQTKFNEAIDKGRFGVAQYYLEQIRTKAETPSIFAPAIDLTIWTIVIFLLLLGVLYAFAWKPMLQGLQKREHDIHSAVEDARTAREEAQRLRQEIQAERAKIEQMRHEIIQKAEADGQRLAEEIKAAAEAHSKAERERMRRELESARDQVFQELFTKLADLAALVSTRAIRRTLTPEDHRRFVDEALAELRSVAGNGQKTTASV
jgi:F-type H+-transporting ATPase subunit b